MQRLKTPGWFVDWSGETVVIIASGPSAAGVDLEPARGRAKFIAINSSYRLCPWADVLYGCDAKWWIAENGAPGFAGIKVAGEKRAAEQYHDVHHAEVRAHNDRFLFDPLGTIGSGGNSGFQTINLGLQFGARKFILVGYDMQIDSGLHWHGAHGKNLSNPTPVNVARWRRVLDGVAGELKALGAEVYNASAVSALTEYPKISFSEAVQKCCNTSG